RAIGSGRLAGDRNVEELVVFGEVEFAIGCRDRFIQIVEALWRWRAGAGRDSRDVAQGGAALGLHDVEERASGIGIATGTGVAQGGGEAGDLHVRPRAINNDLGPTGWWHEEM